MSKEPINPKQALQAGLRIIQPHLPAKLKPFQRLPLKERAVFILHLAGFSYRQIRQISHLTLYKISKYVAEGYEKYPEVKKP